MSANAEKQPVLSLEGVQKSYGRQKVVRGETDAQGRDLGINLDIFERELTLLSGESGSGKTSLLLAMAGVSRAQGSIRYGRNGETDITKLPKGRLWRPDGLTQWRRNHTGLVTQDSNLIPDLSAWENVTYPSKLEGVPVDKEQLEGVCEDLQIEQLLGKRAFELSGGEQQRVSIARALAKAPLRQAMSAGDHDPPFIIFADEPTGALDSENTEIVHNLFRSEIVDKLGLTTVMISHDDNAKKFATRIVEMQDGRVVSDTEPLNRKPSERHLPDVSLPTS